MYQEPFIEPSDLTTKAEEIVTKDEQIRIFPNPAKESFTVSRTFSGNNVELRLYNIVGKIVYSTNFEENSKEISTKNIPNGLYIVSIYSNNQLIGSLKVTIAK
jgi:hypothetical protein